MRRQNVQSLKSTGMLFRLDATPEVIFQRTSQYTHRPLLQVNDPVGRIHEMLQTREQFYSLADHRIDTSQLTIDEVADKIANLFKSHSKGGDIAADTCGARQE